MRKIYLILILFLPMSGFSQDLVRNKSGVSQEHDRLLNAIKQIESGGDANAIGDDGQSIGAYQIQKAYFEDAQAFDKSLRIYQYQDVKKDDVARRVIRAYWRRYATEKRIGRPVTDEDRARIHNGGPNGWKKKATVKYWEKVKRVMEVRR